MNHGPGQPPRLRHPNGHACALVDKVAPVRANSEVRLRFVYYQPLEIDAGVGRYVYPLEDGGTDDQAKGFWTANTKVEGTLSINVALKSAVPVDDVRAPEIGRAHV